MEESRGLSRPECISTWTRRQCRFPAFLNMASNTEARVIVLENFPQQLIPFVRCWATA